MGGQLPPVFRGAIWPYFPVIPFLKSNTILVMKTKNSLLIIILFLLACNLTIAQKIELLKTINNPVKNEYPTINYIGKNNHGKLFQYTTSKWKSSFNLFYFDEKNNITEFKKGLPIHDVYYSDVTNEAITVITYNENDDAYNLVITCLDPVTLKVIKKTEIVKGPLLKERKSTTNNYRIRFIKSSDGSKVLLCRLQASENSSSGSMILTLFNRKFEQLWERTIDSETHFDYFKVNILDYQLGNEGDACILFETIESKKTENPNHIMHILRTDGDEILFFQVDHNLHESPESARLLVVDRDKAFVTSYFQKNLHAFVYNMKDDRLENLFVYDFIFGKNSQIDRLEKLSNGNVVAIGKTFNAIRYINAPLVEYSTFNVYITAFDPDGNVVYHNAIWRSDSYSMYGGLEHPAFLGYDCKIMENDIFVWYNNHSDNEQNNGVISKITNYDPSKPGKAGIYLFHMNEEGVVTRSVVKTYTANSGILDPVSFPITDNEPGIILRTITSAPFSKSLLTIGKLCFE
jgi:hypothetical protein